MEAGGSTEWRIAVPRRRWRYLGWGALWLVATAASCFPIGAALVSDADRFKGYVSGFWLLMPLLCLWWGWACFRRVFASWRECFSPCVIRLEDGQLTVGYGKSGPDKGGSLTEPIHARVRNFARERERSMPGIELSDRRSSVRIGLTLDRQEREWLASDLAASVEGFTTNHAARPVRPEPPSGTAGHPVDGGGPLIVYPRRNLGAPSQGRLSSFSYTLDLSYHGSIGHVVGGMANCLLMIFVFARELQRHAAPVVKGQPFPWMDQLAALQENALGVVMIVIAAFMLWGVIREGMRMLGRQNAEWIVRAADDDEVLLLSRRGKRTLSEERFPRASISGVRAVADGEDEREGEKRVFLLIGTEAVRKIGYADAIIADEFARNVNSALGLAGGKSSRPPRTAAHRPSPASRSCVQSQSGLPSTS